MEEKFLSKAELIINELKKIEKMPGTVMWNDKRASSMNKTKEKRDENSKEGEILLKLDETIDINKRKEILKELEEIRKEKKNILKKELKAEIQLMQDKLSNESERLDRKILKANDLLKRVKRTLISNETLIQNRDKDSLVYKAAKIENEKFLERKEKMPEITEKLKEERKEVNEKIEFYNSIDIEKDGINKLENLINLSNKKEKEEKKEKDVCVIDSSIKKHFIDLINGNNKETKRENIGGKIAVSLFDDEDFCVEEIEKNNKIEKTTEEGKFKKITNKIINLSKKIKSFVKSKISNLKQINLGKNKTEILEEEKNLPNIEIKSVEPKKAVKENRKRDKLFVKKVKVDANDVIDRMKKAAEIKLGNDENIR